MHQDTLPLALLVSPVGAFFASPPSSSSPPHPTAPNSTAPPSRTRQTSFLIPRPPSSFCCRPYPGGCGPKRRRGARERLAAGRVAGNAGNSLRAGPRGLEGLLLVAALADLFDELVAERREVIRLAARHQSVVDVDL